MRVVVVGGGILGLATARELLARRPDREVVVLEKEPAVALHQTGRSSGVVHRGVYYEPGSLKARLCVEGAASLLGFCDEHGIAVRRCGKVVVATTHAEVGRLDELERRSRANGVPGIERIGPERLRELEPCAAGLAALHSPQTAAVDFGDVARALAADVAAGGGTVRTGAEVTGFARRSRTIGVLTGQELVETDRVVVCAGLQADRLAALSGGRREPRIVPFRGDYFVLRPEARRLVRGLVYPVPDPVFPFLGVHFTVRPDGDVWLGPNAVLALARERYGRWSVSPVDARDALAAPGLRRLARLHWRAGIGELVRDHSVRLLVKQARRLLPSLERGHVAPGPSGIRAQALAPDGRLVDDFVFDGDDRVLHVRNAPSPGATSSLAIAREIVDRAERAWA
jgi:(S)-2-hydroxyglutarate dehydrogenase